MYRYKVQSTQFILLLFGGGGGGGGSTSSCRAHGYIQSSLAVCTRSLLPARGWQKLKPNSETKANKRNKRNKETGKNNNTNWKKPKGKQTAKRAALMVVSGFASVEESGDGGGSSSLYKAGAY